MYRSGLIVGAVSLFVAAGAALLSPLCAPCMSVFLGLAAGYLASTFDKPPTNNAASKVGAIGGAVAGIGAIAGQVIGAVINSAIIGPAGLQNIYEKLGIPTQSMDLGRTYWLGVIGGTLCFSVLDIVVMAGFGAVGALLWWQATGRNTAPMPRS